MHSVKSEKKMASLKFVGKDACQTCLDCNMPYHLLLTEIQDGPITSLKSPNSTLFSCFPVRQYKTTCLVYLLNDDSFVLQAFLLTLNV